MEYLKDLSEGNKYLKLEDRLSEVLKPVRPDPTFIDSLKHRLASGSTTILERRTDHLGYLILGLGLFTGALIVWLTQKKS